MTSVLRIASLIALVASLGLDAAPIPGAAWPQFRGPGGQGISPTANPPLHFGPNSHLVWKTALPPGHSSPIVTGGKVFVTGFTSNRLETIAIQLTDGRVLWRQSGPISTAFQNIPPDAETAGLRAVPTPVTDGESVFVFHGRDGLVAYDPAGGERWRMPIAEVDEEATASPILIGDKLIVVSDQIRGSFVQAHDKRTGRMLWHTRRPEFRQSRSTPFHWVNSTRGELVLAGSWWLTSYDPENGSENWRVAGTSVTAAGSPAATPELLFSASVPPGEVDANLRSPDTGRLPPQILPDLDSFTRGPTPTPGSGILAIGAGGHGDITSSHLAWKVTHGPPGYPSPLCYHGRLFTVKAGGFVSAYEAKTGKPIYQDVRLDAPGFYYASLVAATNRIYLTSGHGIVTVLDATSDTPRILGRGSVGSEILATPALVDQKILFRTLTHLVAFQSRAD